MNDIRATLRLQFHKDFTLLDAERLVGYFAELGISHLYASPLQASRQGSPHGYDGVDPTRIDEEIGGEKALGALVQTLRAHHMGLILDIVPNHLAVGGSENLWWQEVLTWGEQSPYATFFDIDWHSPDPLLTGKLLAPFLGAPYLETLTSGELPLRFDDASGFHVDYHEHRFPIDPRHYGDILRFAEHNTLHEQAAFFDALAQQDAPYLQCREVRAQLAKVLEAPDAQASLKAVLALFDATTAHGAQRLHALLSRQHYRLAFWRTASDEINWRRFFDVTELGGLRVEDSAVFEAVHALPLRLVEAGWVDALRIDHVDGLADPRGYCLRLRQHLDAVQDNRPSEAPRRVALYVEKILGDSETLHTDWGVDGTSGYEFMNEVSGLMHDPAGAAPLQTLWHEVSDRDPDFITEVRQARGEILTSLLASEYTACAQALHAIARASLEHRDLTLGAISRALKALVVHFPIYRSYADDNGRPQADEAFFQQAVEGAKSMLSPPDSAALDVLERWLGGEAPNECRDATERALRNRAIVRFQQLTSPVAAKAVEDTAGYRSAALISRNDVGFDGEHFSHTPAHFHAANARRAQDFPRAMVTTATHDHKRGEDVRARLAALSEHAVAFRQYVDEWQRLAAPLVQTLDEGPAPSPGDTLILYQMILAAWPPSLDPEDEKAMEAFIQRLGEWQQKALREAKLRSHWLWPDEAYESACRQFLKGLLTTPSLRDALDRAARTLDLPGAINGLAQATLRLTVPGVADLYQGNEFWDYSLVDPDNRRPVDYAMRKAALDEHLSPAAALSTWRDGRIKQTLVARLLALRSRQPSLFLEGDYQPLEAFGEYAHHVVAFIRQYQDVRLLVVLPRLSAALLGDVSRDDSHQAHIPPARWEDTHLMLPAGSWKSVLTEVSVEAGQQGCPLAQLLHELPVEIFIHDDPTGSASDALSLYRPLNRTDTSA
ncbi:malto-oligosyltrehalose synthase [Vreelandella sp. EE22]